VCQIRITVSDNQQLTSILCQTQDVPIAFGAHSIIGYEKVFHLNTFDGFRFNTSGLLFNIDFFARFTF
jgi:hypothetical protein